MIDSVGLAAALGMVAGATVVVLAVAQLTCEHAAAPWNPRITTVLFGMLAAYTSIDCWDVWAGVDETLEPKSIAFCTVLALSWGYRRAFGVTSAPRGTPERTAD